MLLNNRARDLLDNYTAGLAQHFGTQNPGRYFSLNALCAQYMKAVFARAKADLLGEFATVGRRDSHPGQESTETRAGLLAEASVVIRRMKGLKRATVKKV